VLGEKILKIGHCLAKIWTVTKWDVFETHHGSSSSCCCHSFVIVVVHLVGGLVFIIFALSAFVIEPDDHD